MSNILIAAAIGAVAIIVVVIVIWMNFGRESDVQARVLAQVGAERKAFDAVEKKQLEPCPPDMFRVGVVCYNMDDPIFPTLYRDISEDDGGTIDCPVGSSSLNIISANYVGGGANRDWKAQVQNMCQGRLNCKIPGGGDWPRDLGWEDIHPGSWKSLSVKYTCPYQQLEDE